MSTYTQFTTPRTYRRVSAAALAQLAATGPQAARLAALGETPASSAPLWDDRLLDRLVQPLSRIRE